MPTQPEDIVNEALDQIGVEEIGDLYEGSRTSNVARRAYDPMLRAMHAAAPWNFARRQRQIDMRGDASGQHHNNRNVPLHWSYMYEWPNDCVHARWVLGLDAYALDASGVPLHAAPAWARPAPFIVTDAPIVNDIASDWDRTEGHNPESTRVIATNELGAMLVYTGLVMYPDAWDAFFRQAFVAALAARLAMAVIVDKVQARAIRSEQLAIARDALVEARVRDGNEGWTLVDHTPDWIRVRSSHSWWGGWHGSGWRSFPYVEDAGGVY